MVDAICAAEKSLDPYKLKAMIDTLRNPTSCAPANESQRRDTRNLCGRLLANGSAVAAQCDAAASLAIPGGLVYHATTWTLHDDHQMVTSVDDIKETNEDLQMQLWWGKMKWRPVLTGVATALFNGMMNFGSGQPSHFHAGDLVPVTDLTTNEKDASGAYIAPAVSLQKKCFQTTLAPFVGTGIYPVIAIQGTCGKLAVKDVCSANSDITITPANIEVLNLMGFKSATELQLSTAGGWGAFFVNRGEQLLLALPSLGSGLSGPTCGGGDSCLIVATNCANFVRVLQGRPPILIAKTPLLACTQGGCSIPQMQRLAVQVVARQSAEGFKTPSQNGGTAGLTPTPPPPPPHTTRPVGLRRASPLPASVPARRQRVNPQRRPRPPCARAATIRPQQPASRPRALPLRRRRDGARRPQEGRGAGRRPRRVRERSRCEIPPPRSAARGLLARAPRPSAHSQPPASRPRASPFKPGTCSNIY